MKVEPQNRLRQFAYLSTGILETTKSVPFKPKVINPDKSGWIFEKIAGSIRPYLASENVLFFLSEMAFLRAYFSGQLPRKARVSLWYTHPKQIHVPDALYRKASQRLENIIFQTNHFYDFYNHHSGVESSKFHEVWGGVDDIFLKSDAETIPNPKNILVLARYYKRKNPEFIARLSSVFPNEEIRIIGPGWCDVEALKACSNVTMLESVSCFYQEYKMAKVLISPSLLEGGPIPVLEAAALGVPILGFNTGILASSNWDNRFGKGFNSEDELFSRLFKILQEKRRPLVCSNILSWREYGEKIGSLLK